MDRYKTMMKAKEMRIPNREEEEKKGPNRLNQNNILKCKNTKKDIEVSNKFKSLDKDVDNKNNSSKSNKSMSELLEEILKVSKFDTGKEDRYE